MEDIKQELFDHMSIRIKKAFTSLIKLQQVDDSMCDLNLNENLRKEDQRSLSYRH